MRHPDILMELSSERLELCLEQASDIAVSWFGKDIVQGNPDLVVRMATAMLMRESAEIVCGSTPHAKDGGT